MSHNKEGLNMARCVSNFSFCSLYMDWLPAGQCHVCIALIVMPCSDALCCAVQRLIQSMDNMTLDAFIYPGWGNPPRLIGDLSQSGNTPLGATLPHPFALLASVTVRWYQDLPFGGCLCCTTQDCTTIILACLQPSHAGSLAAC